MKRNYFHLMALASLLALTSCNDYLERKPLDFTDEEGFFQNAEHLKWFVNDLYSILPLNDHLWGGLYTEDIVSDNQCSSGPQELLYPGLKQTVAVGQSQWNFKNLRALNYYLNKVEGKMASGELSGTDPDIRHYLGEGYFLRAWDYFRLLQNFGDVPIVTEMMENDQAALTAQSVRAPRNEVARFILKDLDFAIERLQTNAPEQGRITRDAALILKSRVALFEATWERYHAGTCFVPGNAKWPGQVSWPDYKFPAGSAEAEINFFLDEAIAAADEVAARRTLNADYAGMFNKDQTFGDNDEVVLARYYALGVCTHSCSAYLKGGGGCNVTRAAVNTFLMQNGLPIYDAASGYLGDRLSYYELQNRDNRLTTSVRAAGSLINTIKVDGKNVNDTIYYHKPAIDQSGRQKATTGYELEKWVSPNDENQRTQDKCTTSVPILRAAEAYVNYLEAYYERHHTLGGNCDRYWRALRTRAGVDTDYNKTILATDLSQENDLAIYSHGKVIDKTLYNIRRERRCEFIAEGQRLRDLKRWRSLDNMVDYQPEGLNFWDELYTMYKASERSASVVSQSSISKYIHPLQISSTSAAYEGYNFPKPHYLEPIPISEFLLTGNGYSDKSPLYQNPGWPQGADGTADYTYDCD